MDSHSTKIRTRTRSSAAANAYDDLPSFRPPALSPSEDDYCEIFGGFQGARGASSIPVLDLPPVDHHDVSFDFRFFDYSEVFGGFEGLDYAVPFDHLFSRSNGLYVSSSDDAWTPVETDCLSEEWDASPYSSEFKNFGDDSNQRSTDAGKKQFSMSFLRKNQVSEEDASNTAHVAPVLAVPGYAFVVEQVAPSEKIEFQNPRLQATAAADDEYSGKLIKGGKMAAELSEKPARCPEIVELDKVDIQNGSNHNEMFVTISEINLKTQPSDVPPPSRPPPIFDARDGNTSETTSSLRAPCGRECSSEVTSENGYPPPFLDVKVDASSSAACTSSVRESMKNSQVKLTCIKEYSQKENTGDAQHPSGEDISGALNSAQAFPVIRELNPVCQLTDKKKSMHSWSSEESCKAHSSGEWTEVAEFFELVRSGKSKTPEEENGEKVTEQNAIVKEGGEEDKGLPKQQEVTNKRVSIMTVKSMNHVGITEVANEVTQDENLKEAHLSRQTAHNCEEEMRKLNQGDFHMKDDIFIEIVEKEPEIEKELNKFEQKRKHSEDIMDGSREIHEVGPEGSFAAVTDGTQVNDDCLKGQSEMKSGDKYKLVDFVTTPGKTCEREEDLLSKELDEREQSDLPQVAHEELQQEMLLNANFEREEHEYGFKEAFGDEEKIKNRNKMYECEEKEKHLKETLILEESERRSKDMFGKEENERRKKEEEYVAKLMEASENEAEEMLKEALEEVKKRILMEDLERAEREQKTNEPDQQQNQNLSEHLSRSEDNIIFECAYDNEPDEINSGRSTNLTTEVDKGFEATSHCNKNEKSEKAFHSVCDPEPEQDNSMSTHEVFTVKHEKSDYKQGSDEGGNEKLSATGGKNALHYRSSNAPSEARIHTELGVQINNKLSSMAFDSRSVQEKVKVGKVTVQELQDKAQAQTKVIFSYEVNNDKDKSAQKADGEIDNSERLESAKSHLSDERKQTEKLPASKISQNAGEKGKCRTSSITPEEREKLGRARREREMEMERLRQVEEEWEREREREKDREAFEGVTRIARETAYVDVRERAERAAMDKATAVARQRALAEARERLEKACAEAKEKAFPDIISTETRVRREQSAQERMRAEARERADRSISACGVMYPSTSNNPDRSGGIEVESAQRCKARLERHQRTAERAAKALAEKNTRDLIAQREQAERHRLAESLDAEVKRWSNGKQGNLRALLSTLQYILGAESGWQPVPLTDIITSAAVKKAYRKATLCVHPDKLQQRRATIQQKYICEKVFDLLKEAWNRFNSEER
uniref:J domain-containing protein n=2 Tax=Kalanchoe fedtschenkoi TaxID=63787 RepID=A0A7N0RBG3_KALFE